MSDSEQVGFQPTVLKTLVSELEIAVSRLLVRVNDTNMIRVNDAMEKMNLFLDGDYLRLWHITQRQLMERIEEVVQLESKMVHSVDPENEDGTISE